MHKLLIIIKREYLSRVTKRSFILTTLLVPFVFALFPVFIFLISGNKGADRIAVVDDGGRFKGTLNDSRDVIFIFEDQPLDSLKLNYNNKKNDYTGILHIPKLNSESGKSLQYFSNKSLGFNASFYMQSEIGRELEKTRLAERGLNQEFIDSLKTRASIETIILSEEGERSDNKVVALITAFLMGLVIYITLIIYGVMVMNGVVEEKANRILEVIVSSVKPFQMLLGKILGIAAVGLTQLTGWIVIGFVLAQVGIALFGGSMAGMDGATLAQHGVKGQNADDIAVFLKNLDSINFTELFFMFLFYFLGGYLFYASQYAAAASGANDPGDTQSLSFPITIPIIISFFMMQAAVNDPQGSIAFWFSMIPFTSPIVMLGRIPFGVPAWQLALSMSLLILGFLITTWIASKIYRVGILMYGKKVTYKELAKWIFYKG